MTSLFILLTIWMTPAHADLKILCQMSRMVITESSTQTTYETIEQPIHFVTSNGQAYKAVLQFNFKLTPNYSSTLTIHERLIGGRVVLRSELITRDRETGDVVARGLEEHSFEDLTVISADKHHIEIFCNGYDKTGSLGVDTVAVNRREKLRIEAFGGPASRREYVEKNNPHFRGIYEVDYLDLFRHLLEQKSLMGDLFREVVQKTIDRGFIATGLDTFDVLGTWGEVKLQTAQTTCSPNVSPYICDIEKFGITQGYAPSTYTLPRVEISVEGQILRDSKSRTIKEYIVDRIITHSPYGPAGGGSSTSGGRIKGQ